jgi:hypothetical protein
MCYLALQETELTDGLPLQMFECNLQNCYLRLYRKTLDGSFLNVALMKLKASYL